MSQPAIRVSGLSKLYHLGTREQGSRTFKEAVVDAAVAPFRRIIDRRHLSAGGRTIWALQDVSFDVHPGEAVGVIGGNGAGKSTLLKMLARIVEPTRGRIEIAGRIASLLEVGTGFHPELSGRENIFLNGAILGMTRREIQRKYDEIVAFAEVERFIDTPVKRYSSGMHMRLAFAVAAHLEQEILLVDEVLAVGDVAFQKKCLGKMGEVAREGRTIFFVSHNTDAVKTLCTRALYMRHGRMVLDADPETATAAYLPAAALPGARVVWGELDAPRAPEIRCERAYILNSRSECAASVSCGEEFVIGIDYQVLRPVGGLRLGFSLQRIDGVSVCTWNDPAAGSSTITQPGSYSLQCTFPSRVLNEGDYAVRFTAESLHEAVPLVTTPYCLGFSVEDLEGHGPRREKLPGLLRPRLQWRVVQEAGRESPVGAH